MGKSISRFEPTPSRTPEECERHYTEVHVRMAQELLRPMPALVSYHVDRAVAQADVIGGWAQRPRAWRFVVLRFTPGEILEFSARAERDGRPGSRQLPVQASPLPTSRRPCCSIARTDSSRSPSS